jgi:hypothetical protein
MTHSCLNCSYLWGVWQNDQGKHINCAKDTGSHRLTTDCPNWRPGLRNDLRPVSYTNDLEGSVGWFHQFVVLDSTVYAVIEQENGALAIVASYMVNFLDVKGDS